MVAPRPEMTTRNTSVSTVIRGASLAAAGWADSRAPSRVVPGMSAATSSGTSPPSAAVSGTASSSPGGWACGLSVDCSADRGGSGRGP